jgi:hypothetical protein
MLAFCYGCYAVTRMSASDDREGALAAADGVVDLERHVYLDFERTVNLFVSDLEPLAVGSSFWYASAHYVVTTLVLIWAWRRGPHDYLVARRALLGATLVALLVYLVLPTAPPRFVAGYRDVMAQTADVGWWGDSASAPAGFGHFTNQLAAMPSMHAGWALWVAIVVGRFTTRRFVRTIGWLYAGITGCVIVAIGSHWVLDALAGWALVSVAAVIAVRFTPSTTAPFRPRRIQSWVPGSRRTLGRGVDGVRDATPGAQSRRMGC